MDFGDYRISSDENNYVVQKKMTHGEKSKKAGESYYKDVAFYPTSQLDKALLNIFHRKILKADKDKITFVINAIKCAKEEIISAVKTTE